MNSYVKLKKLT